MSKVADQDYAFDPTTVIGVVVSAQIAASLSCKLDQSIKLNNYHDPSPTLQAIQISGSCEKTGLVDSSPVK